MTIPAHWKTMSAMSIDDLRAALVDHFAPVLATTPANRALLERIMKRARQAKLDTSHEEPQYHSLDIDFGSDRLRCCLPETPDPTLAASFRKILELHGRLQLIQGQIDLFHETSVDDEGWLDGTDLSGRGVYAPMRAYADLYIYHPDHKTADGEPALYFLDHAMVDEDGPQPVEGDIASVFLQRVAKCLKV
jgi:hypothetical protein